MVVPPEEAVRLPKVGCPRKSLLPIKAIKMQGWLLVMLLLTVGGCGDPSQPSALPSPKADQETSSSQPKFESPVAGVFRKDKPPPDKAVSKDEPEHPAQVDALHSDGSQAVNVQRRIADDRPPLNEKRLQANGISRYDGRRLILLSDLPADKVTHLPALADQLFAALEAHFGPLPPALDGSEFQVTGHLMADENRFQAAGLMPPAGYTFRQGRHLDYQFWMYDQTEDYYRRHLLFHEFVHCFMTCESGMQDIPPLWYIEGMAEYFATHRLAPDGQSVARAEFAVLPDGFEGFEGWGRISELKRQFRRSSTSTSETLPIPSLPEVMPNTVANFQADDQYAASWALCWLLQTHPKYESVFDALKKLRRRDKFIRQNAAILDAVEDQLRIDWLLTVEDLEEGFDAKRSFPVHQNVASAGISQLKVQASYGWQDSGLRVSSGNSVRITCDGRFSVNDKPTQWVSEPQGVSIEYHRGHPLGKLIGIWVANDGLKISPRFPIGRSATINAPFDGSLWLQVNDSSASRHNNDGEAEVSFDTAP